MQVFSNYTAIISIEMLVVIMHHIEVSFNLSLIWRTK